MVYEMRFISIIAFLTLLIMGAVDSARIVIDPKNPLMTSFSSYHILYGTAFDPSRVVVEIVSMYPWDEGTLQLLKTIHVEKIN